MLYGYRYGEEELPPLPDTRDNTKITGHMYDDVANRRVVQVDLGVAVHGVVQPHPDTDHGPTVAAGSIRRICGECEEADPHWLSDAKNYSEALLRSPEKGLEPLPADTDLSVDFWLDNSNYPMWKKEGFRKQRRFVPGQLPTRCMSFASFIKSEFYALFKHARTIQGPDDEAKVHVGAWFAAAEKRLFDKPWFIKKIPVRDRPKYIMEMFGEGRAVAASDFTSFEMSWQRAQMEAFEFPILERLFERLPNKDAMMRDIRRMEYGRVRLVFKHVTTIVKNGTRKSGTMNTSLSNGGGNWLIHEYLGYKLGLGKLTGIFEGDDGLFCYESGKFPSPEDYKKLGFSVKLDLHDNVTTASFCGMVFDAQEQIAIWDPVDYLVRLGWSSAKYMRAKETKKKALLRAKAMSMAAQMPRCPVLAECAAWILRCTKSIDCRWVLDSRNTNWWDRQVLLQGSTEVDLTPAGPKTRLLIEEKFGLSVSEQLRLEDWFRNSNSLEAIPLHVDNEVWMYNWDKYVRHLSHHSIDSRPIFPDLPLIYPKTVRVGGTHNLKLTKLGKEEEMLLNEVVDPVHVRDIM